MYGHCKICGKMYGTKDAKIWAEPCEHMLKELKAMMDTREHTKLKERANLQFVNSYTNLEG